MKKEEKQDERYKILDLTYFTENYRIWDCKYKSWVTSTHRYTTWKEAKDAIALLIQTGKQGVSA